MRLQELTKVEVGEHSDEPLVLLDQLGSLCVVLLLGDLVVVMVLLHQVHQSKKNVELLLVLDFGLLGRSQSY